MKYFKIQVLSFFLIAYSVGIMHGQKSEIRNDFKRFYNQYNVEGSFVLYDLNNNKLLFYNKKQYHQEYTPASTFKICNSLIGLETGVIPNENYVIPWDGINREVPGWNIDHDLKKAFINSTVWYYQELARRVGGKQMKEMLDRLNYGNADTTGGIDRFWLSGGLRITPEQQIDFLKRLHDNNLPVSQRSLDIVKTIMIVEDTVNYVLRAKTGWGEQNGQSVGWYIGWLETDDNVYYFTNCIQSGFENENFATARKEIVFSILNELHLGKDLTVKKN